MSAGSEPSSSGSGTPSPSGSSPFPPPRYKAEVRAQLPQSRVQTAALHFLFSAESRSDLKPATSSSSSSSATFSTFPSSSLLAAVRVLFLRSILVLFLAQISEHRASGAQTCCDCSCSCWRCRCRR